jgi:hypothetical protein
VHIPVGQIPVAKSGWAKSGWPNSGWKKSLGGAKSGEKSGPNTCSNKGGLDKSNACTNGPRRSLRAWPGGLRRELDTRAGRL